MARFSPTLCSENRNKIRFIMHTELRVSQGRSDGGYIGIYTLTKSVPELIAADVVRLLVYT